MNAVRNPNLKGGKEKSIDEQLRESVFPGHPAESSDRRMKIIKASAFLIVVGVIVFFIVMANIDARLAGVIEAQLIEEFKTIPSGMTKA